MNIKLFKEQLIAQKNPEKLLRQISVLNREERFVLKQGILELVNETYNANASTLSLVWYF